MAADVPPVWYITGASGAPEGPFNPTQLADLLKQGGISTATLAWCEGMASWLPLEDTAALRTSTAEPSDNNAGSTVTDPIDELAAFRAEIQALEGDAGPSEPTFVVEAVRTPEDTSFIDDDGTLYIWDHTLRKYIAQEGEAAAAIAQNYDLTEMTFVAEEEVIPSLKDAIKDTEAAGLDADTADVSDKKRKADEAGPNRAQDKPAKKKKKGILTSAPPPTQSEEPKTWFELKVNTSVYVTGLPDDITSEEVFAVFSKCGFIKEDDDRKPRIKLYRDKATGMLKGDALVTYLKEPSVLLATQILDGTQFRPGQGAPMSVTPARFEMKGQEYQPKAKSSKNSKKAQLQRLEKSKLGWFGADNKLPPEKVTVILKHMFDPAEFVEGVLLPAELEEDVKAESSKLGLVEKVRIFNTNPEGVVSVRFVEEQAAHKCLDLMNGRWFGGRQVVAHMWDGQTNYAVKVKETAEEQEARLEAFARALEQEKTMVPNQEETMVPDQVKPTVPNQEKTTVPD